MFGFSFTITPTYVEDIVVFVLEIMTLILPLEQNRRVRWCRIVGEDGQHYGQADDQAADHVGFPAHSDPSSFAIWATRNSSNLV